jgi:DnaJ-class molecular chaperone
MTAASNLPPDAARSCPECAGTGWARGDGSDSDDYQCDACGGRGECEPNLDPSVAGQR